MPVKSVSFEIPVDGGLLRGHRGGSGRPALLLHGGAAIPDYLGECAAALDGLFETFRYTQRGTPPSGGVPPYTIETHVADAVAVLDRFGLERAWAIGHSWGGHLAMHLALAAPERLEGLLLIDPLGADASAFPEAEATMRRDLTPRQRARIEEIEQRRRDGRVTEAELVERFGLLWPRWFARPEEVELVPSRVGVQASIEVNRSIGEHFKRRTLEAGLPDVALPALFVHGESDPMPLHATQATAALIPGARVEAIPDCGHFPWLEQPAAFRAAVERLLA